MLQVDERFEIPDPTRMGCEGPYTRRFHWVEHYFDAPLWYVEVLPPSAKAPVQYWRRFLVTRAADAAALLNHRHWESTRLHVLLPTYMIRGSDPEFSRCLALWQCHPLPGQDPSQPLWLFESEHGTYVEPTSGLDVTEVSRFRLHWRDARDAKPQMRDQPFDKKTQD
ncbi:hypothetical protein [Variovorax atrisoli]|uniref:hypothetical protein n=1 Tax=Variovorax atrisoli TaxID=3394203 RepID=UPI0012FE00E4|nr:hypothetical protein [Variovorax paradoxus]